jgi:hypothetical protein
MHEPNRARLTEAGFSDPEHFLYREHVVGVKWPGCEADHLLPSSAETAKDVLIKPKDFIPHIAYSSAGV